MNSNVIYIIDDVQESQHEPEKLEKENNNVYRIVGIIDGHYIVKIPKVYLNCFKCILNSHLVVEYLLCNGILMSFISLNRS
jgi:hypothetical protein